MRRARGLLALAALLVGCGGGARVVERDPHVAARPASELCRFDGRWTSGSLRTPAGGFTFASLDQAQVRATLDVLDGPPRLRVESAHGGWVLAGRIDLGEEDALRAASPTWLSPGVLLVPGSAGRVIDAREGELLVGPPHDAFSEAVRFVAPADRWVPCDSFTLASVFRDPDDDVAMRRDAGLPAQAVARWLAPGSTAQLSAEPGGAPLIEIGPREWAQQLDVIEERAPFVRVVVPNWTGVLLVGWTSSPLTGQRSEGGFGLLGALGGEVRELRVCTSPERLTLFASRGGAQPEAVGAVEPGTRFVVLTEDHDVLGITPHPSAGVRVSGEGVTWSARSSAPLTCAQERHDPLESLRDAFRPQATLAIRATVIAAQGEGLAAGTTCELDVDHRALERYPCRTTIRCGGRVVYGHRETNGAFECELDVGDSPFVVGQDAQTSAESGDGAIRIDTRAGTLTIDDDAQGPVGALHVEARIDSVVVRDAELSESRSP